MSYSSPSTLVGIVAAIASLGAVGSAAADTRQACGDAYYAVQVLRDEGKYEDALYAAEICVSDDCAKFVRDDCTVWKREIEALVAARRASLIVEALDEDGLPMREATATLDGAAWLTSLDGEARDLPPGTHEIEVSVDGQPSQRRSVIVRAGEQAQRVVFTFGSPSNLSRGDGPIPWILGGVGLAALVAGATTGGFVIDAYLTTQEECDDVARSCSPAGDAAADRGRVLGPTTTGLLVGGVVLMVTGLVWKLADPGTPRPPETSWLLTPRLTATEVGLVFQYAP
jgi:hypothetical protein